MYVITITDGRVMERVAEYMRQIADFHAAGRLDNLRVAIDPLDSGLKFSVNWSTWSPPFGGVTT